MAVIKHITYKCDICGKESDKWITNYNIRISCYPNLNCISKPIEHPDINLDICKDCSLKINSFIIEMKNESAKAEMKKTCENCENFNEDFKKFCVGCEDFSNWKRKRSCLNCGHRNSITGVYDIICKVCNDMNQWFSK